MHLHRARLFFALGFACLAILPANAAQILVGSGPGGPSWVNRFSDDPVAQLDTWAPFTPEFLGGVSLAAGDGRIVVGAGSGGASHVKVFNASTLAEEQSFFAFPVGFTGGIDVAIGGGRIAVGAGVGGGSHVKIYDAATFAEVGSFFAFTPGFTGGIDVAIGGGRLAVGAGAGGGSQVKVYDAATLAEVGSFFAFTPQFTGGVTVAIGEGKLAVGVGSGGGPQVKIYDAATLAEIGSFFAFAPQFTGGVTVAIGEGKLVVGAASGGSQVNIYDLATLDLIESFLPSPPSYQAGARVAITALPPATSGSTLSPTARYAYAANFGWIDGRPSSADGVRLTDNVLSGWLYSANTGWIHLGDGTPVNGVAYANDSATDYGVNVSPSGALTGQAWSPSLGWLTFEATYGKPAVARSTGVFTGHVWVPNAGWISLGGFPSALVSTTRAEGLDSDEDGLPDYWEIQRLGDISVATGTDPNPATGSTYRAEYLAATGPFNFGGYSWSGGHVGAPNAINVIQNWSPRVPPETFTGFNGGDDLNVNAAGATVNAGLAGLTIRSLNFNSSGGRLELLNCGINTTDGLNLRQGTLDSTGTTEVTGPVATSAGTTIRLHDGAGQISGASVTNAGTWQIDFATLYASHFINQGSLVLPNPDRVASFYGHFQGAPGSTLAIDSAQAAPGQTGYAPGAYNDFAGSLDWVGSGDLDIGPRSWTFVTLGDRNPADRFTLNLTNRFRLSGVDVTLDDDAFFTVQSGSLTLYDKVPPQVELSDLTLTNNGTFRFQVDEIALRNLDVTGNPIEIIAQNGRTTRIRELTQAVDAPGALRADVFGGNFALDLPRIDNAIELTLGRAANGTFVALPDFVNNASLLLVGGGGAGSGYDTRITPPVADTPASPIRTLTNSGTLAFGPGGSSIATRVVNTGKITVDAGADVALDRPLDNRAALTIAPGGRLVSGATPASPTEGPFLPVTWQTGEIVNEGEFVLRGIDLQYAPLPAGNNGQSITFTGNGVTFEDSLLRLDYNNLTVTLPRFAFRNVNRIETGGIAKRIFGYWRVEPNSTLQLSSVVNGGTFELAGSANGAYPTAFLNPTSEFINVGLFRTVEVGGFLQGPLINFGQIEITPASRLTVYTPLQAPEAAVRGRLINNEHASIHIAPGGTLQLAGGYAPIPSFELLGGTVANEGRFLVEHPSNFLFAAGAITGNPVEVTDGALQINTSATDGTFLLRGTSNTLALDPFNPSVGLAAGITLHLEGGPGQPSVLSVNDIALADVALLQKGTFVLDSTDDESSTSGSATLQIGGTGFLALANTGKLHLARAPGKNRARFLDCHVNGPGRIMFDDGVDAVVTKPAAIWVSDGPFEFGRLSALTFGNDAVHFDATPTSDLHGSGTITFPAAAPMQLAGKLRPEGLLHLATGLVNFRGQLVSRLRTTGVDRIVVDGDVDVTGARVEFGVETGATPVSGTRYTVLTAASIRGSIPTLTLDSKLADTHTGVIDFNSTTLGVTLYSKTVRTFASWAASHNLAGAAATSDADGDGIPLLQEYVFGLDPTQRERSPVVTTLQPGAAGSGSPGRLAVSFPWHRDARDFTWQVETSTTLAAGSWTPTMPPEAVTTFAPDNEPDRVIVTVTFPVSVPRTFARVVVSPGTPPPF